MRNSSRYRLIQLLTLIALLVGILAAPTLADERITSFRSDITVNKDGTMNVVETIKVISEQNEIRHGIYREFPTRYKDRNRNDYVVGFDVLSVTRDGTKEPYHTAGMSNGVRVYIGDAGSYVSTGEHVYTIAYKTDRQFGFFKDHDELYWNVTGNGWIFPIMQASAVVTLPPGVSASDIKLDGWTGPQGSTAQNLKSYVDASGRAVFYTTTPLYPFEGLTIGVWWPKGIVSEPTQAMRLRWFFRDNKSILILLAGLLLTICYFLWAQMKVGIDPQKGAIVPQWDAPDGLSPAAVRYIGRMGYDNKTMSAALINAAVKGYIEIAKEDGVYSIRRKSTDKSLLTPEELAAIDRMLGGMDFIVLDQANNASFRRAIDDFGESLQAHFGAAYFATHSGYAAIGALLSLITLAAAFLADPTRYATMDIGIVPILVAILLFASMNLVFLGLLKSYTKRGRQLMDKAEGLRLYMRVAEQERLEILNPPDKTPQLYEKLLPYALALGVEQQWSEQFADVLQKAQAEGYHPAWYIGPGFYDGGYSSFASSVGNSFASAISSAATPPGSSGGGSGFGGGGFGGGGSSGGGGGGGGGGGW